MSESTRVHALQHAVAHHAGQAVDPSDVVNTAEVFHSFIVGEASAPAPAKTAAPAKAAQPKAAPAKAAQPKAAPAKAAQPKAAPEPEPEAEPAAEDAGNGVATKEQVGEAIETLLNANARAQVIKLFGKYGAKSLSSVKPEDYDAILADANDLLLSV